MMGPIPALGAVAGERTVPVIDPSEPAHQTCPAASRLVVPGPVAQPQRGAGVRCPLVDDLVRCVSAADPSVICVQHVDTEQHSVTAVRGGRVEGA